MTTDETLNLQEKLDELMGTALWNAVSANNTEATVDVLQKAEQVFDQIQETLPETERSRFNWLGTLRDFCVTPEFEARARVRHALAHPVQSEG